MLLPIQHVSRPTRSTTDFIASQTTIQYDPIQPRRTTGLHTVQPSFQP
jgi:hypothetical protein